MSSWFYNKDLKPQGPLTLEELKKKIMKGEIRPGDLVMKDAENWLAAVDWKELPRDLFPAFQNAWYKESKHDEKEWILLGFAADGKPTQEGPYSVQNLKALLQTEQISADSYIWRSGLSGWVQLQDREEFHSAVEAKSTSPNL